METEKKVWVTPELIILVRSAPEEAVLAVCKGDSITIGPRPADGECTTVPMCDPCNSIGLS
jgi:hypothetical protein